MLIKLPILINGKKIDHTFRIKLNNNIIELTSLENKNIVNVICFNNGIYGKVIYLPMIFFIDKNYIFNEFFFYNLISNNHKEDFFTKIINCINEKENKKYKFYKNLNENIVKNIFDIYDKKYQPTYNFNNINEFFNFTFYRVVYNLNKYLYLFFNNVLEVDILNDCSKKTKTFFNLINQIKIFYDKKEACVFKFINKDNLKTIINNLFIFKYDTLIEITIKKIYKIEYYNNFYKYNLKNNIDYLIYLKLLKLNINNIDDNYKTYFNDVLNISKENISFDLFKVIVNKDKNYNKDILNNLFCKCDKISLLVTKNKLSTTFKKIIYYSFRFVKKINLKELTISIKIKYIYNIIYDILKNINNSSLFINNKKIYEKQINTNIIKLILIDSNILEINDNLIKNIINSFNKNLITLTICKNINYFFINYQQEYYKYIFNELERDILFFDTMDNKVKELIQKPYIIFNNMDDRLSILKWLHIVKKYIHLIYFQPIKINNNDIINLSEILYHINNIKEQKLNCIYYKNLLTISNKFKNLIIFNDRINLKINDIFPNKNINLGHLVKNIKNNNNSIILHEDYHNLNKYKMKYLKYKGKYLANNTYEK